MHIISVRPFTRRRGVRSSLQLRALLGSINVNSRAGRTPGIPSRSMDLDSPARLDRPKSLEGKRRGGRRLLYHFRDTIRCYSYYDPYKGVFLFSRHIISTRPSAASSRATVERRISQNRMILLEA